MKRDLDLIRRILLDIEERGEESKRSGYSSVGGNGQDPETIQYHVQLLNDAGLIVADEVMPGQWWPERITWAGHEFLDLARNETLWRRTITAVERALGSAPFHVVQELLSRNARDLLEAPRTRKK